MNRNNERHFNNIPRMNISRSRFKMKQDVKLTLDAGKLIPFYVAETLPGDTFSVDTTGICRMATPIYPVMDNCYLDIYYFHVPMRIVWEHAKEFFGENNNTAWTQTTEYKIPELILRDSGEKPTPLEGSILDYMGVPTKFTPTQGKGQKVAGINILPLRAYAKIWQEWFRDQNVDNPVIISKSDFGGYYEDDDTTYNKNEVLKNAEMGGRPLWVNKFHDRFTSALPSPQKGEPTLIPLGGDAQVYAADEQGNVAQYGIFLKNYKTPAGLTNYANMGNDGNNGEREKKLAFFGPRGASDTSETGQLYLKADLNSVTGATINNLRQAFAVQQFMEADARGGSRYREIIRNHFGVDIDDKTVQIPEYLGGQRYMINVSQVVQTSATDTTSPQGNAAAISVTPFKENSFTKSFQEHGYVIGVCCIRNDNTYQQGLDKMWSRKEKYDFYWPEFAHLGEQAILNKEIYMQGNENDEKAFGYQEAYSEYRMTANRVCGKFRSNAEGTLDAWHYADNYSSLPTLSQEWMASDKTVIDRTIAVQNQPQFIMDILIENDAVRPMPIYGTPGLTKL